MTGAVDLPEAMPGVESRDVVVWHSRVRGLDAGDGPAQWLSSFLGVPHRILRFDRSHARRCNPEYAGDSGAHTMFADGYPLLVIGQSSLDDLNARLVAKGAEPLPMNRFRPNLVIAGLDPNAEDHLDTLESDGVTLRLVKPCVRCTVTTTDQASGRVGVEPLHTLSTYRRNDALFVDILTAKGQQAGTRRATVRLIAPLPAHCPIGASSWPLVSIYNYSKLLKYLDFY